MTKLKTTPSSEQDYSPEFKLQIVLEYIRSPKRKKQITKDNHISEELLEQWHQEFVERAGLIFGGPQTTPEQRESKEKIQTTTEPTGEPQVDAKPPAWGVRIYNGRTGFTAFPSSATNPPGWLGRAGQTAWQEHGVVVWNEGSQKIKTLSASEALDLLGRLRERGFWRTNGIAITQRVHRRKSPETKGTDRSGVEKKGEPVSEEQKEQWEVVDEVLFRLDPRVGEEFFAFLQEHEALLKQKAEEEKKAATATLKEVYNLLLGETRKNEMEKLDLTTRPLKWTHEPESNVFVCNSAPNRATVTLGELSLFWLVWIERPDRFKQWSSPFGKLEEALTWAEQELKSVRDVKKQADGRDVQAEYHEGKTSSKTHIDLTPYRINPADLEPKRLSYRVVIDLNHAPESFKTMEMSFGKLYRYNEKFPSTTQVARELHIDLDQATIEQPLGPDDDWYRIHSVAVYYQADVADAQAQRVWSQSTVHSLYKEGKIRRARYSVEEEETHYCRWLGGIDDPEKPWSQPSTREEHMAGLAMRETFAYALDVDGYRKFLRLSPNEISDEELLKSLHSRRARSAHIPEDGKTGSKRWLERHPK